MLSWKKIQPSLAQVKTNLDILLIRLNLLKKNKTVFNLIFLMPWDKKLIWYITNKMLEKIFVPESIERYLEQKGLIKIRHRLQAKMATWQTTLSRAPTPSTRPTPTASTLCHPSCCTPPRFWRGCWLGIDSGTNDSITDQYFWPVVNWYN